MKDFYDSSLKFLSRPMLPPSSVSHSDYLWRPQAVVETVPQIAIPTPVAVTKISIDRAKVGYSKYLDPAATSYRLDFCNRTPTDIGANNNITFWNWNKIELRTKKVHREKDPQQCDKLPSNECTKRREEYPSTVKAVPNFGLTTETTSNYTKPMKTIDNNNLRQPSLNDIEQGKVCIYPYQTEYASIIGLQEKTEKYV